MKIVQFSTVENCRSVFFYLKLAPVWLLVAHILCIENIEQVYRCRPLLGSASKSSGYGPTAILNHSLFGEVSAVDVKYDLIKNILPIFFHSSIVRHQTVVAKRFRKGSHLLRHLFSAVYI